MVYTFQISDVSPQSQSIINLLINLSKDYDFLKIVDDETEYELTSEQEKDLDRRYENFLNNPRYGTPWSEMKENFLA